jgi:YggT family protein
MIILANFLWALAFVLKMVLGTLIFLVIARAIISWVNPDPYNPIVRFLVSSTDPFLRPLRRRIPPVGGGIDLTPIVLLLILYFLQEFLVTTLADYSISLKHGAL